jgi:hypothetical protein
VSDQYYTDCTRCEQRVPVYLSSGGNIVVPHDEDGELLDRTDHPDCCEGSCELVDDEAVFWVVPRPRRVK